jgi:hypothetical protein
MLAEPICPSFTGPPGRGDAWLMRGSAGPPGGTGPQSSSLARSRSADILPGRVVGRVIGTVRRLEFETPAWRRDIDCDELNMFLVETDDARGRFYLHLADGAVALTPWLILRQ